MALKEPYCDIPCADIYLVDSVIWNAATDDQKNGALFWGRTYLDSKYKCPDLILDPDNPSDEIKYANALLAEDYLEGNLLNSDGASQPTVKSTRVKAGSVESEKEFLGGNKINYQQDVDSLLSEQCRKIGSGYNIITRV